MQTQKCVKSKIIKINPSTSNTKILKIMSKVNFRVPKSVLRVKLSRDQFLRLLKSKD
jgi:hypothetical protein